MNILKISGFQKNKADKPYPYKNILHLWEDDYLMLELLPAENLAFVQAETQRINNFAREHFDGSGFTDITPIAEKPVPTIEKLIDIAEIESMLNNTGLEKIKQFHMQGVGLLEGAKAPLGFGTNKFAIMCERQNDLLKDIWITGHTDTEADQQKLVAAILLIGRHFNFIAVNWYQGQYYNLMEKEMVEEFVKNS
jgi:hypothetical protein